MIQGKQKHVFEININKHSWLKKYDRQTHKKVTYLQLDISWLKKYD